MAILANELRIGNWVNFTYKHKGEYNSRACRVIGLDDAGQILVLDKGLTLELRGEAQPIPLSPEVLEACGFSKLRGSSFVYRIMWRDIEISVSTELDFVYIDTRWGQASIKHPVCEYLHQLQNLYFSLTGEELNYSPKIK